MNSLCSETELNRVADSFKAMANPCRLAILFALVDGERCVQQITDALTIKHPNISMHLRTLQNRKLIRSRRDANRIYYSLTDPELLDIIHRMRAKAN